MKQLFNPDSIVGKIIENTVFNDEKLWLKFANDEFIVFSIQDISSNDEEYEDWRLTVDERIKTKTDEELVTLKIITRNQYKRAITKLIQESKKIIENNKKKVAIPGVRERELIVNLLIKIMASHKEIFYSKEFKTHALLEYSYSLREVYLYVDDMDKKYLVDTENTDKNWENLPSNYSTLAKKILIEFATFIKRASIDAKSIIDDESISWPYPDSFVDTIRNNAMEMGYLKNVLK